MKEARWCRCGIRQIVERENRYGQQEFGCQFSDIASQQRADHKFCAIEYCLRIRGPDAAFGIDVIESNLLQAVAATDSGKLSAEETVLDGSTRLRTSTGQRQ